MKLGIGYYSLARIGQRLVRADEKLNALKQLYREAQHSAQMRGYERVIARQKAQEKVAKLREKGLKFREIGDQMKVSRQRAIQIYQEHLRSAQPLGMLAGSSPPSKSEQSSRRGGG